ncbi:MAG: ATP-binding protein [Nitrospiraceae bacterium]|nr:ATP-binding protein [Nitrospiraceae bacterium]
MTRAPFVKSLPNVASFTNAVTAMINRRDGAPGMVLVQSNPGYGKTETGLWWAAQTDSAFVEVWPAMSPRWLMESIVAELKVKPTYGTQKLVKQAQEQLLENPRTIILDEVDHLNAENLKLIKRLHDCTGAPIVFIGEDGISEKLKRHGNLYSRFGRFVKFQPLSDADIRIAAQELCAAPLDASGIAWMHVRTQGSFRLLMTYFEGAEKLAKVNKLSTVTAADLKKLEK